MGRILCIDYGLKRCGLAQTDPLQIAAHPLCWVETEGLWDYITHHIEKEQIQHLVIGDGRHHDGQASAVTEEIETFVQKIKKKFSSLQIELVDEAYSSVEAKEVLLRTSGQKKRRQKGNVDMISAVIILQRHLGHL